MTEPKAQRPSVTLKLATSLDGRISTVTGHSKWITGPLARERVHKMRGEHDCVLTGIGTVLADDPELTARSQPIALHQPLRVVVDSHARTPVACKLLTTLAQGPVCLFHRDEHANDIKGLHRIAISQSKESDGLELMDVLSTLRNQFAVQTVMVEAGARLAGAFLRAGLVDSLVWFRAPLIIGGDGLSVFSALGVDELSQALVLDCVDISRCGRDAMETYLLKKGS